jgi:hypothetical protein
VDQTLRILLAPQLPDASRGYPGALSRRGRAERTRSATSCSTASSARWQTAGPGTHGLTESDSSPSDEPTMPIVNRRLRGVDTADRPPVVAVGDGPSVSGQPARRVAKSPRAAGLVPQARRLSSGHDRARLPVSRPRSAFGLGPIRDDRRGDSGRVPVVLKMPRAASRWCIMKGSASARSRGPATVHPLSRS